MPLPPPGADWYAHPITYDQARAQYPREEVVIITFKPETDVPPYLVGHGLDADEAYEEAYAEAVRVFGPAVNLRDPHLEFKYGVLRQVANRIRAET